MLVLDSWYSIECIPSEAQRLLRLSPLNRYLAEWMVHGYPSENVWELDLKRFGALQSSRTFLRHRVMEVMRKWNFILSHLLAGVFFSASSVIQRAGFPQFFSKCFKLSF